MIREPIFSIFTPVFNSEKYIKQCIESVINQTVGSFEWYIYDDGSKDNTFSICEEYAKKDDRIFLTSGKNGTSILEMNNFIEKAKGKYIAFIDNDDFWDKDYLEIMFTYLDSSNSDCAISSYTYVNEEGEPLNWYSPHLKDREILDGRELKLRFLTSLDIEGFRWNKIYKSHILKHAEVRLKNIFPADIPFEYAITAYVDKAILVPVKGYYYRQSALSEVGNTTVDKAIGMLEMFNEIGEKAIQDGFLIEGRYYKSWRYVNSAFSYIKNSGLSSLNLSRIFSACSWKRHVGKGFFETIQLFNRYNNLKDGNIKFFIKTFYVWINSAIYRGKESV